MSNSILPPNTAPTMLIGAVEVPVLEYQNQRVVTFAMMDEVHQRPEGTAGRNFRENRQRFKEGIHYFHLSYQEVKMNDVFRRSGVKANPQTGLIVLTGRGYLLIVKSFTDDLAWEVQEILIDAYFRLREVTTHPSLPYHLQRYLANRQCIPYTHFSILSQMSIFLTAPLENLNYTLPDNLLPDISEGLLFNRWLREEKHFDTDTLPTYTHTYEDGRQVKSKLYPLEFLPDFIKHFHEVWLMQHAQNYFSGRDDRVLPLMPKLLENRLTKSLTDLLKEHNSPLSARKANQMLLELGILEEQTRASATKGTKQYKALTEQGSQYGKNVVNPLKPEETQPRYYVDTFQKLLEIMEAYLTRH